MSILEKINWRLFPEVERFLIEEVEVFLEGNTVASHLAKRMQEEASVRFFDWIDHMIVPKVDNIEETLVELRYRKDTELVSPEIPEDTIVYIHPESIFFPVLVSEGSRKEIAIKPDVLDHFVQMYGKDCKIEGEIYEAFRRAEIHSEKGFVLSAVERRGYAGFTSDSGFGAGDTDDYVDTQDSFYGRIRYFDRDDEGLEHTLSVVLERVSLLGKSRACDAFFRAERRYWESRERTGQIHRNRQDRMGLGWGNHDHHAYRSSRENFPKIITILEALGFEKREQFFAGTKAGWGAQVLEHPICNIVIFADVDISEEERDTDFTKKQMETLDTLGTVGMWVGLHGESMLQAGLHHLAARVDYESTRTTLPDYCAAAISPFSYFDFLKQSFTESDRRPVNSERLNSLLQQGHVSEDGMKKFLNRGAIGSHLEIIQREQGFKGFNQDSVTAIIHATDPRRNNE